MDKDQNDRDTHETRPPARVTRMDLDSLPALLGALDRDAQRRGRDASGALTPGLDIAGLERTLDELRACLPLGEGPAGAPAAALARREEAVARLAQQVELRLAARGSPATLAQGLRRLEDTVYREPEFSDPSDQPRAALPPQAVALRERFDAEFCEAQAAARALLRVELGLAMVAPQVGEAIDPVRHNVVGSVSGDDPSLDNTVAQVESPVWLLGDAVLARADVIRYSCSSAGLPRLPAPHETRPPAPDEAMVGRKTDSRKTANGS